jgi:hypothetical protein
MEEAGLHIAGMSRVSVSRFALQYVDDGSRGNGRVSAGERILDSLGYFGAYYVLCRKLFPISLLLSVSWRILLWQKSDGFGARATSINTVNLNDIFLF